VVVGFGIHENVVVKLEFFSVLDVYNKSLIVLVTNTLFLECFVISYRL
jgi:hypothetical protein